MASLEMTLNLLNTVVVFVSFVYSKKACDLVGANRKDMIAVHETCNPDSNLDTLETKFA